jgi:hypothetical protein
MSLDSMCAARPAWYLLSQRLLAILDEPRLRSAAVERHRFLQLLELEDDAYAAGVANALIQEIEAARAAAGLSVLKRWRPARMH